MKTLLTLLALMALINATAQTKLPLTLDSCYALAAANYPMIHERALIEKSKTYSISNASMGYLPTVSINAQDTYQSDVTKVPRIPALDTAFPVLSKNQYKVYGDMNATLYDGGLIKQQKQLHEANAKIEEQSLEIELYSLRERVNQVFFGALMLEGQLVQNDLLRSDISNGLRKVTASIANGTALKSSADVLQAELLKANQNAIELQATRTAFLEMLGMLIARPVSGNTTLERPVNVVASAEISRPELTLYEYHASVIDIQNRSLNARQAPKLSAFFQGGYGKPGLNMLNTEAASYYITGVRLNWTLTGFYTHKKDKELLEMNRQRINLQKETFLFNTSYQMQQQRAEVDKLRQLSSTDNEIIALRTRVKQTASAQLENGVIDSHEYLHEVNAENQARQTKVIHEIQLLLAQYTLQTTTGI